MSGELPRVDRVAVLLLPRWVAVCGTCGELGTWLVQGDAIAQGQGHAQLYHVPVQPQLELVRGHGPSCDCDACCDAAYAAAEWQRAQRDKV